MNPPSLCFIFIKNKEGRGGGSVVAKQKHWENPKLIIII